ncbi:hypothetical protein J2125_000307 [Erwinia toletana]|uniref:Uncharacterized protein n=1 Tax=Winslowiella toletana TaxID=92490 RepID=A0ABS4P386_9GAMM|nr:hypothetical protein [Winslowiella toletana]MBP2167115.1 hypothetical protein [Winslowiella toletana]
MSDISGVSRNMQFDQPALVSAVSVLTAEHQNAVHLLGQPVEGSEVRVMPTALAEAFREHDGTEIQKFMAENKLLFLSVMMVSEEKKIIAAYTFGFSTLSEGLAVVKSSLEGSTVISSAAQKLSSAEDFQRFFASFASNQQCGEQLMRTLTEAEQPVTSHASTEGQSQLVKVQAKIRSLYFKVNQPGYLVTSKDNERLNDLLNKEIELRTELVKGLVPVASDLIEPPDV